MCTNTKPLEDALAGIPLDIRRRLIEAYVGAKSAHSKRDFDTAALRAGKACESIARFIQLSLTGSYTPFGTRLPDLPTLCRSFEQTDKTAGDESLRILIPRAISFVYTLRNKRGGGHAAGDVDANAIDSATILRVLDWSVAELVRRANSVPLEDAQAIIDLLAQREIPSIWAGAGGKRVLIPKLTRSQQVLVLLYSDPEVAVPVEDLAAWVEAPRLSQFIERSILPMHSARLLEFDRDTRTVILLPPGEQAAEAVLVA